MRPLGVTAERRSLRVNARNMMWGDRLSDERSELILDFAAHHGLEIQLSTPDVPTFVHNNGGESYIDIVMARLSPDLRIHVSTLPDVTHDHRPLLLQLRVADTLAPTPTHMQLQRYNMNKADWTKFSQVLQAADTTDIKAAGDLDAKWDRLCALITDAADQCIPKKKANSRRCPFWSEELRQLRLDRNRHRSAWLRVADRQALDSNREQVNRYKAAFLRSNSVYKRTLRRQKEQSFQSFIERESASDPWSIAYKVCRDKVPSLTQLLCSDPQATAEVAMSRILDHFFGAEQGPVAGTAPDVDRPAPDDVQLTDQEICSVVESLKANKAPGADLLTGAIIRAAYESLSTVFNDLYKCCFREARFPKKWKEAVLAVVPKPGKSSYQELSSFRPISLLSVAGKVLDRLLADRVNHHLYSQEGLMHAKQYGFKPQHSTEMAIAEVIRFVNEEGSRKYAALIALDIKSAFDTASHRLILQRMTARGVPGNLVKLTASFFSDRSVSLYHESLCQSRALSRGCPQGSVSGPSLWNLLIDDVFAIKQDDADVNIVCFADDTMIQVRARTVEETLVKAEQLIERAMKWCADNELTLNMSKTEVMLVPRMLRPNARETLDVSFIRHLTARGHDDSHDLQLVPHMRYLGVILDAKLNFHEHIQHVSAKTGRVIQQLSRGARTTWGFSPVIMKTLYERCIEPIALYACNIWGHRVSATQANSRKMSAIQRLMLIRTTRAYRTVSHAALCAMTGVMPINIRIREVRGRSRAVTQTTVEQRVPFSRSLHPASNHRITFSMHQPDSWPASICLFTDGSRSAAGVGCAFVVFRDQQETARQQFKLHPDCSVFQAEMYALVRALHWVTQLDSNCLHDVALITDSQSALMAMRGSHMTHPLVHEAKQLLVEHTELGSIKFFHTQAHIGTQGNERADQLAKYAASVCTVNSYSAIPVSHVKQEHRWRAMTDWQTWWHDDSTGRQTHAFIPHVRRPAPLGIVTFYTTQFLTGHGSFGDYLTRFRVLTTANSACYCGHPTSNPQHVLFDCPTHADHQFRMHVRAHTDESLHTLIQDATVADAFMDICRTHVHLAKQQYQLRANGNGS